jgi:hypothetical protein
MTHLEGRDRFQTLLLPESLDDYVGLRTRFASSTRSLMGLISRSQASAGFSRKRPDAQVTCPLIC